MNKLARKITVRDNIQDMEEVFFQNIMDKNYHNTEDVLNGQYIIRCGDGEIGFTERGIELFEYFDEVFKGFARKMGAEEEKYPVLLKCETLKDTGYLKISPQYVHYVNPIQDDVEVLEKISRCDNVLPYYADAIGVLSPSACFHVYERYRGNLLEKCKAVTLLQSVFRNEGRFGWKEYGRLRDYHVREIVFIGNEDYVRGSLMELLDKTSIFIKEMEMSGEIKTASDPFVLPNMQRHKIMQLQNKVKYEVRLNYSQQEQMSAASFNLHGKAFTFPFHISVKNEEETVTGCVGYGIERWVLAYLSQYGGKKIGKKHY